jgi:hypothetical protein
VDYPIAYTILDFRFWILDWEMLCQLNIPEIEIIQIPTKLTGKTITPPFLSPYQL